MDNRLSTIKKRGCLMILNSQIDNLVFEICWREGALIALRVEATSKYVSAWQSCLIQDTNLENNGESMIDFSFNPTLKRVITFGKKEINYTPAFEMTLFPADARGHIKIEVDIEIEDNNEKSHRCLFYIESEIGLLEKMGLGLKALAHSEVGRVEMQTNE